MFPVKKLTPVQITGVKIQEYFEMLLGQMEHSTVDSMVTTGLALHEMLALCARSILAEAETTSTRQVILQAAETLRKHYQKELCLADLLAEAHMSKSYFLRLFRRYMGTTPYNYLVNFRITQAKELLVLTDHSVSEIAQEVVLDNDCADFPGFNVCKHGLKSGPLEVRAGKTVVGVPAQIGKAVLLGVGFQNPFLVRYGIAFALQLVLMGQSRIKGGNEVLGGLS